MFTIEPETATSFSLREQFQIIADKKMGKGAIVVKDRFGPDSFYAYAVPPDLQDADPYKKTHAIVLRIVAEGSDLFVSLEGERITPQHAYDLVSEFYRSLARHIQGKTTAHLRGVLETETLTREALTEIANALHKVVSPLLDSPEPQF